MKIVNVHSFREVEIRFEFLGGRLTQKGTKIG